MNSDFKMFLSQNRFSFGFLLPGADSCQSSWRPCHQSSGRHSDRWAAGSSRRAARQNREPRTKSQNQEPTRKRQMDARTKIQGTKKSDELRATNNRLGTKNRGSRIKNNEPRRTKKEDLFSTCRRVFQFRIHKSPRPINLRGPIQSLIRKSCENAIRTCSG